MFIQLQNLVQQNIESSCGFLNDVYSSNSYIKMLIILWVKTRLRTLSKKSTL